MLYHQLYFNPLEQKSAVVLLHAFPLNSKMWEPQIEKLIEEIQKDPSMEGLIQLHLEKFYTDETRANKPELIEFAETLMKEAKSEGVIQALKAMANRPDSTDLLKKMDFPVLVIAGEKDSLTSVQDAQVMADQLQKGELSVISNDAHLSNLERPEEFNKNLMQYVHHMTRFSS